MPSPSQNFTPRVYHGGAPPRGRDPGADGPDDPLAAALEILAVTTAAIAAFFVVGGVVAGLAGPGLVGLAAAQLAGLGGVPVAWALVRGDARARLGLRAPPLRAVVGAILVGVSLWYVTLRLDAPIARWLGTDDLDRLTALAGRGPSLAARLAVVAAITAACEEVLCRGVLARGLRPAAGATLAALLSALAFAVFHLSLVRFVPTFTLGAVMAALALRTDSVVPSAIVHFLNNATALLLVSGELPTLARSVSAHPDLTLGASVALTSLGLVISLAPPRPS